MSIKSLLSVGLAVSVIGATALPAAAETIYLKNGTRIVGKITKEDPETFVVETKDGRRKVPKREIETLPKPEPFIALATGILIPGGGQIYLGQWNRAGLYAGLGIIGGALGFASLRTIRPSSPSTAAVTGLVLLYLPGIIGAFDASTTAEALGRQTRYHIDYGQ